MSMRNIGLTIGLFIGASQAGAQLYLITGSPTPKYTSSYAATLVRIDDEGGVKPVADLIPAETGAEWITISHEAKKAVLLSRGPEDRIVVVDFDKAAIVKACDTPPVADMSLIEQWLVNPPSRGLTFVEYLAGDDPKNAWLQGMLMDESVPCDRSFVAMEPGEMVYVVLHGRSGVSDFGSSDVLSASIGPGGNISRRLAGSNVAYPYEVPEAMRSGLSQPLAEVLFNNSDLMALGLFEKAGSHRILVYRKRDQTWHRIPIPYDRVLDSAGSTPYPWVVGFGNFLALAEAQPKGPQVSESAGRAGWRTNRSTMGPDIAERFRHDDIVYPGRLHLYNVDNGQSYTIVTNQGDSEILLVEGNVAYYRVSDRVYQISISGTALGPARLIAQSELLRDAHWAFLRKP